MTSVRSLVSLCQVNLCSLESVSCAVDRVVSGRESMIVSAGCVLVEINELRLIEDVQRAVSRRDTRTWMLRKCERWSDEA
jgi:hypothetical protein